MTVQNSSRALAPRRHDEILRRLTVDGSVSIAELAAFFQVSRETIRRDMRLLAERGQLDLVHGGARSFAATEPALLLRSEENTAGKAAIGKAAAALVEEGMVVFIDSGTSALEVANALTGKHNLTICTPSLVIALLLCRQPSMRVHILGGEIDPIEEAASGIDALEAISRYRIDIAFLGAGGLTAEGAITDFTRAGAEQRAHMLDHAAKAYFLLDSSKFGRLTPMRIRNFEQASGVIVDSLLPAAIGKQLKKKGIRVIVAG